LKLLCIFPYSQILLIKKDFQSISEAQFISGS
jgi:hypothetical protein